MTTVRRLIERAARRLATHSDDPLLDSQVLLAHVLGRDRSWLYAWPERELDARDAAVFEALLTRRQQGRPVAQLVGGREFWSLYLAVNEATLIPRPETEQLVEVALQLELPADAQVLDLGTGSGAVALALASERPGWTLVGVDRSPAALDVARANAASLGLGRIEFLHSDWFDELATDRRFHLIVGNPPYVAAQDPHLARGDLRFEPREALVSGDDGLDDIRRITATAADHLHPGGWLWLEHGCDQGEAVTALLRRHGFERVERRRDLAGRDRLSGGRIPAGGTEPLTTSKEVDA